MMKEERKKAREERYFKTPVFERFEVGLFLSLIGGFLDAYTFVARGGVFANAQTGNIILFALNLCQGNFFSALKYVVPIAFFVVGVIISEFILSRQIKKGAKLANYAALLCIEAAVLVGVAFIPFGNDWDMLANATVSFVASVEYSTFRKMENVPFATSFCTGNLRTATQYFYRGCAEKDVEKLFVGFKLAANIVCFAGGVAAGYFVTRAFSFSPLAAGGLLLLLCGYLAAAKSIKYKKLAKKQASEAEKSQTEA